MEFDKKYLPYVIYQNILKFLEYRKLDLVAGAIYAESKKKTTTDVNYLDQEEFIKSIQYYGYVLMEAKDKPDKDRRFNKNISVENITKPVKTFILLFEDNNQSQSSQAFVKILTRIPGFDDSERNYNIDVIIINREDLNVHLMKKVELYTSMGDSKKGYLIINSYKYLYFTSIRPEHKLVAKQRIITKDEENIILGDLLTNKKKLPKIQKRDVIAVWLGAEVDDIVEALIPSEASGIETKYLVVRS